MSTFLEERGIQNPKEFENGCKVHLDFVNPDYTVSLFLPEETKWRFCGNFNPEDGILFMKKWKRHKHNILNAYGISSYVIDMLEPIGLTKFVLFLEDTREAYEISLEEAKNHGIWKFWKEQGLDRQLFAPLTAWDKKR